MSLKERLTNVICCAVGIYMVLSMIVAIVGALMVMFVAPVLLGYWAISHLGVAH